MAASLKKSELPLKKPDNCFLTEEFVNETNKW